MDFSERLLQQSDEHRQRACANTDFELAVYCRESRDVMRRQAARIAALESQLAAQAAAVEVLKSAVVKIMPLAQQTVAAQAGAEWMQTTKESGGPYPSDKLIQMRADMKALAALVAAAGKEDGK